MMTPKRGRAISPAWCPTALLALLAGLGPFGVAAAETTDTPATRVTASAELSDREGDIVGTAELTQFPAGVHILVRLDGLPPGVRAFHIHETGSCDSADFSSAGGHFALDGEEHGFHSPHGPHAGDLPNLHIPENGALTTEFFNQRISLIDGAEATLFDADGAAFIVHAGADDYVSQPAGNAGERIACGVIHRSQG